MCRCSRERRGATPCPRGVPGAGPMTEVTLVTTLDCHLCDDARGVVAEVLAAFPEVVLTERSLLDDRALREEFAEDVPVVIVDGRVHTARGSWMPIDCAGGSIARTAHP